jgi:DNA primase
MRPQRRKRSTPHRQRAALDRRLARILRDYGHVFKQPSVDQLKAELNIERVIAHSLHADTEVIHGEPRWLCPFHDDHDPSLWAHSNYHDTGVGRFGCNPCGFSGDVFDWVMKYHDLSWTDAEKYLRRRRAAFRL